MGLNRAVLHSSHTVIINPKTTKSIVLFRALIKKSQNSFLQNRLRWSYIAIDYKMCQK